MKLQEIAFMLSLIKASYRRRMTWFIINMVCIFVPVIVALVDHNRVEKVNIFGIAILVLALIFGIVRFFVHYDEYPMPWIQKNKQIKDLKDANSKQIDFEKLGFYPSLQEYFNILK